MPYIINLIDVDGTQLVFSSEMALTSAEALEQIKRYQAYALSQAWPQARITVIYGATWSYSVTDVVDADRLRNDNNWANVEPEAGPCPDAPELPWGWDQIDYPDPLWAEDYDADGPSVVRGEAEITEAEAADLNTWLASLPQEDAAD